MAGYSDNPLYKKLGLKEGFAIKLVNAPDDYKLSVKEVADKLTYKKAGSDLNFIHLFTNSFKELKSELPALKKELKKDGTMWVSWYKKAAKKQTELTENVVREVALQNGLVDVKVCAFDDNWSGLKLVFRLADR